MASLLLGAEKMVKIVTLAVAGFVGLSMVVAPVVANVTPTPTDYGVLGLVLVLIFRELLPMLIKLKTGSDTLKEDQLKNATADVADRLARLEQDLVWVKGDVTEMKSDVKSMCNK